jgi:hypothetical protein
MQWVLAIVLLAAFTAAPPAHALCAIIEIMFPQEGAAGVPRDTRIFTVEAPVSRPTQLRTADGRVVDLLLQDARLMGLMVWVPVAQLDPMTTYTVEGSLGQVLQFTTGVDNAGPVSPPSVSLERNANPFWMAPPPPQFIEQECGPGPATPRCAKTLSVHAASQPNVLTAAVLGSRDDNPLERAVLVPLSATIPYGEEDGCAVPNGTHVFVASVSVNGQAGPFVDLGAVEGGGAGGCQQTHQSCAVLVLPLLAVLRRRHRLGGLPLRQTPRP